LQAQSADFYNGRLQAGDCRIARPDIIFFVRIPAHKKKKEKKDKTHLSRRDAK